MLMNTYLNDLERGASVIFDISQNCYLFKNNNETYFAKKYVKDRDEINNLYKQFNEVYDTVKRLYSGNVIEYTILGRRLRK